MNTLSVALVIALHATATLGGYGDQRSSSTLELFPAYPERVLQHAVNMLRIDPTACAQHGYCGARLHTFCPDCSLNDALSASVYPGVQPLRYSTALSEACRTHLERLDACGATGLEHAQPARRPCDASTPAQRVSSACSAGRASAFGETLAAFDVSDADAFLPLAQWTCERGADGECAPAVRGLSADTHREQLLDPTAPACCADGQAKRCGVGADQTCVGTCRPCTAQDERVQFTHIGAAYYKRADGKQNWCVELTNGACTPEEQAAEERLITGIYSATHLNNFETDRTRFVAVFWPEVNKGSVYARLVLNGETHEMAKEYPSQSPVRGHYKVSINTDNLQNCQAYHFEFLHTDPHGTELLHRYPEEGELLTAGVNGCTEAWDAQGLALSKRFNDPDLEDIDVELRVRARAINNLARSDSSRRNVFASDSIAATEDMVFNITVTNLGLADPTAATRAINPVVQDVRVLVFVNCDAPGSVAVGAGLPNAGVANFDASVGDITLNYFNHTASLDGASPIWVDASSGLDVGTFTVNSSAVNGFNALWETRVLEPEWTGSVSFRISTTDSTANGDITCTGLTLAVLNEAGTELTEPELFSDALNVTDFSLAQGTVQRRTDIALSWASNRKSIVAGDPAIENTIVNTLTVVNNGPLIATDLDVFLRLENKQGLSATLPPEFTASGDVFRWFLDTLPIGEPRSVSFEVNADSSAEEGSNILSTAFVGDFNEQPTFVWDDSKDLLRSVERQVDLRLTHSFVARRGPHGDSARLTIRAHNDGPSDVAVLTLIVVVRPPAGIQIDRIVMSRGKYLAADAADESVYGKHEINWPVGKFHYWVIGPVANGGQETISFDLSVYDDRKFEGPLQVGAAVDLKRLQEKNVLATDDDALFFTLNL